MTRYPNLFLVGAPKCGTTSLAYYLSQHTDIFTPVAKAPTFFVTDFTRLFPQMQTVDDYLSLYRKWNRQHYALDASDQYFYSKSAAQNIFKHSPDAEIIIMVRSPIEASYSMYFENRFAGVEEAPSFEESLNLEAHRIYHGTPPNHGILEQLMYSRIFSFTENILRYQKVFGPERICTVLLDDLKQDVRREVARILTHIKLSTECVDGLDVSVQNTAKHPLSRHLARFAMSPPFWMGRLTRPFLTKEQRVRIRTAVRRINVVPREYPPMLPETRRRLAAQWAPEVRRLSELLDRDLSHWLKCDG